MESGPSKSKLRAGRDPKRDLHAALPPGLGEASMESFVLMIAGGGGSSFFSLIQEYSRSKPSVIPNRQSDYHCVQRSSWRNLHRRNASPMVENASLIDHMQEISNHTARRECGQKR
ncbi:hypothetical protein KSP40_PGU015888 [Platanthera guangdongensis]|uniref:Uncharacterized protein n=1 Tax=Platanthera guangdongensis TaxID=2320717 RepID=A0ABR2MSG5_9ASPA